MLSLLLLATLAGPPEPVALQPVPAHQEEQARLSKWEVAAPLLGRAAALGSTYIGIHNGAHEGNGIMGWWPATVHNHPARAIAIVLGVGAFQSWVCYKTQSRLLVRVFVVGSVAETAWNLSVAW